MSISYWIPAISTTGLLALLGWLFRNWILKSIGFEFDKKLEFLKSQLRMSEEKLRADLHANEVNILALRSSVMTTISNRQIAVDKRRLEAIDQLWQSIISLNKARSISVIISQFNFEELAKRTKDDEILRNSLEMFGQGFDMTKDLNQIDASKARPFVSPLAWALYTAIITIIFNGVIRWYVAKSGLGSDDFFDHVALLKMVKEALPEYTDCVDKYGVSRLHSLVDILESKLLSEFRVMMSGAETDQSNVEQAAKIIEYSKKFNVSTTNAKLNIPGDVLCSFFRS
jgi:hypothetical protein